MDDADKNPPADRESAAVLRRIRWRAAAMTPPYPRIWFLRHGQTEWNSQYRLQGQLDSPLTDQGIADARRQARIMRPVWADQPAVYASPLGRVQQTAAIVLGGRPHVTDPRLMEIHAGAWQGRLRAEIMALHPDWAADQPTALAIYERAEGGEGLTAFRARILSFLADLTGPTVILAHGLLGQVLRAEVLGLDPAAAGALSNRQGCVYLLDKGKETVLDDPS